MTDRIALSDAADLVRDCIEALAKLDSVDAISDEIRVLEDARGRLQTAECRASDAEGVETGRQERRNYRDYLGRAI